MSERSMTKLLIYMQNSSKYNLAFASKNLFVWFPLIDVWSINYTNATWSTKQFAFSWQMLLPLCKVSRSRKLQNLFYSNFTVLCHFWMVCKIQKLKEKNWRHIFSEIFFHVLSKCKSVLLLIRWSHGTLFGWQIHLHYSTFIKNQ